MRDEANRFILIILLFPPRYPIDEGRQATSLVRPNMRHFYYQKKGANINVQNAPKQEYY